MKNTLTVSRHPAWLPALFLFGLALVWFLLNPGLAPAAASEKLVLSCSAQVYESLRDQGVDTFTKETGIKVILDVSSSKTAVARLANGLSDLAATAEPVALARQADGFFEYPFCKDALVIITGVQTGIHSLDTPAIRGIFSGTITNWREIGGPDKKILVIVPSMNTAAHRNFLCQVMGRRKIAWDIMTARSTAAGDAARKYPWSISFVSQGATQGRPGGTRIVKVAGVGPTDPGYPFFETFALVTRGRPTGAVKKFVDFIYSRAVRDLIIERGMIPLQRP